MFRKYAYVPHTADIAFIAYGRSVEEMIENAALALINVMSDVKKIKKDTSRIFSMHIKEKAGSIDDLVWMTLQDLLSRKYSLNLALLGIKVSGLDISGGEKALKASILYKKPPASADYSLLEVKAVTPHNLKVKKRKGIWGVEITVDI